MIALEAVFMNRLRAFLTALGIVFGVAAVIAMLAIGAGAQQELLAQMKLVGTNNIVIKSVVDTGEEEEDLKEGEENKRPYSPGLSLADVENITAIIPTIEDVSPEVVLSVSVVREGRLKKAKCVGVENTFFELNNLPIDLGRRFQKSHLKNGSPVCIIGKNIQNQFFSSENPVGKRIKCGNTWLTVIGVTGKRLVSKQSLTSLGIRDYNSDIYVPVQTALMRFKNRAMLTSRMLGGAGGGRFIDDEGNGPKQGEAKNYHQLDRLVVRVKDSDLLQSTADIVARMLHRRHWEVVDYEVTVPELLIKQQQRTQDLFNYVLGAIAGISLLVGGIGIMNIMLASVLERIKEIGLRRSLGATQPDVVMQFVFEAVFISLLGGIIGVFVGILLANIVSSFAEIPTVISGWSVALSFGVAAMTGLVFGIIPARRAAKLDPIIALRRE